MATISSRLCFASTQASWWCHVTPLIPTETPTRFWGVNPKTVHQWFWSPNHQTPREVYPLCFLYDLERVTIVLDRTITKSSNASAWLGQPLSWLGRHGLLLHMYSCSSMPPSLSDPWSDFWPSWPLSPSLRSILHRSQSIGTAHLYLTFSMVVDRLCAPHMHINTVMRHVAHILTPWLVSKLNQSRSSPDNHSSQLDTHKHRAHINHEFTVLGLLPPTWWLVIWVASVYS
jgi:hypothetical protein